MTVICFFEYLTVNYDLLILWKEMVFFVESSVSVFQKKLSSRIIIIIKNLLYQHHLFYSR